RDGLPAAQTHINIFPLKKSDAPQMAALLQQLFLGTASSAVRPTTGLPGAPTTGLPGAPTGLPGIPGLPTTPLGGTPTGTGTGVRPLLPLTTGGDPSLAGAPLIELRISVDQRTNSVIVAGSPNDLSVAEAVIYKLEDSDMMERKNQVYRLKNTVATDVANALNTFLTNSLNVTIKAGQLTAFQEIERDVVIVAEPISNVLIVSATPRYYDEIIRLINELDVEPLQ